ncbi:MAG: deoxyribodipyrimidine photo-lyase [Anaerolineae bacterium]|nr:deoxyribodipyrimidine photo-lyase [Anaerolineae bacterium]
MSVAIWWIQRDLRLSDNQALSASLRQADIVIPLFILDPRLLNAAHASHARTAFLLDGLRLLDADLRQRGSALIVRQGNPIEELQRVFREAGASVILAEADVSPYARQRDSRVQRELPLILTAGVTVYSPQELLKPDGSPYTVFTPFSRKWKSLPLPGEPLPAPDAMVPMPALQSLDIPTFAPSHTQPNFIAGEKEALDRLGSFVDADIYHYSQTRDRMDLTATSGLSPYLRFGMLSARQAVMAARKAWEVSPDTLSRKGAEAWLNELIWREFYAGILDHFPHVLQTSFRRELGRIPWLEDEAGFLAWSQGRTGYPIIDAGMRQLNTHGWMHNRARMLTASFLVKDLLIDWRRGAAYFMELLVDGDPAANNGGWQWTAGTGTDAAPYFRVFNPVLQAKKFDPSGAYVRRWVPELSAVPDEFIHAPQGMPANLQAQVGCVIGKDYPAPIVDHAMARQRALEAYRRGKYEQSI